MKVKDILKKVNDPMLYIEIKDKQSGASYGFYKKADLVYNNKHNNDTIKSINSQYFKDKRLLVLEVE